MRSTAPVRRPAARHARLHRVVFHSPLRGTRESLLRQNERIDSDNLERIQNDSELEQLKQANELVALPDDDTVQVSAKLPQDRRYCRPWTRDFVVDLGQKSFELFRRGIVVTSAVRTIEVQHKLIRHNGNAAPEAGELASPHLSGAAVDVAKRGLTRKQLAWIRTFLLQVQNSGMADVEEEFRQSVFHITVYREYTRMQQAQRDSAQREAAPLTRNQQ